MKWSENTWAETLPVYQKILTLPFIQQLIDGTLDKQKFLFYIQQDALYLAEYGKVLTGIASRLNKPDHIESFIHFSGDSIAVEKELHASFKDILGGGCVTQPSPTCLLYTSFLLRQLVSAPIEVIVASVLPCFRIYKEVGDYILENQKKGNNPYQSWIDTYGGESFAESVKTAIAIADELAASCTPAQQKAMTEAYVTCSKMEWMFWDSAWKQEEWPI